MGLSSANEFFDPRVRGKPVDGVGGGPEIQVSPVTYTVPGSDLAAVSLIHSKYRRAIEVLSKEQDLLDYMTTNNIPERAVFEQWLRDEEAALEKLSREPLEETLQMEYVRKLGDYYTCQSKLDALMDSIGQEPIPGTRARDFPARMAKWNKQNAERRRTENKLERLVTAVEGMEEQMGIQKKDRWKKNSEQWREAERLLHRRRFQKALDRLQYCVVSRLLQLSKTHMVGTSYHMRQHIAKAISSGSNALQNALAEYNAAAEELGEGHPQLTWNEILEMGVLEDFDLLRLGREDIRDAAWAQPGARVAMDLHFRLLRAKEEVVRCNVEIKQFSTWMKEEREFLVYQERRVSSAGRHARALQIRKHRMLQGRFFDLHRERLEKLRDMEGFTGDIEPGVGVCDIRRSVDQTPTDYPTFTYSYPLYGIHLRASVFKTGPAVAITDAPHAAKTGRNQPQHGPHTASLGRGVLVNHDLLRLQRTGTSGLLKSDVVNVDKQDDGAARRLWHHTALVACTSGEDEAVEIRSGFEGLFVYLFTLGLLFDAWMNRTMTVQNRVLAVLRARFFLHFWRAHVVHMTNKYPDLYSPARSFISPASFHIFNWLCDSMLLLVLIYAKYYPDALFCPWLMGTECRALFWARSHAIAQLHRLMLSGRFKEKRERNARAGYILDFDTSPLTAEDRELARVRITPSEMNALVQLARRECLGKRQVHDDSDSESDLDPDAEDGRESAPPSSPGLSEEQAITSAAHDTARYAALCEDYDNALQEAESHPAVFGPPNPEAVPDPRSPPMPATSSPPASELIDASGKLCIAKMLRAPSPLPIRYHHPLTANHSARLQART
ncbi:hypothetical protein HMN09_00378400 [Mycena chlorophos]|uniref:Uncharacterized protein n=1 Tax=Mycena chlorophos TaxID=658473 RepID=A0A8H6TL37_MYCCL|nr:hypothetical protein HMN09_00378400 [Mycena chlorophos]